MEFATPKLESSRWDVTVQERTQKMESRAEGRIFLFSCVYEIEFRERLQPVGLKRQLVEPLEVARRESFADVASQLGRDIFRPGKPNSAQVLGLEAEIAAAHFGRVRPDEKKRNP